MAEPVTRVAFAIPGDIDQPTGGYAYDRRVLALMPDMGIAAQHLRLPDAYPDPGAADLAETERLLGGVPAGTLLLIDGLAYGAMPADLIARLRRRIVALVHHPLCLEAGLTEARQAELRRSETAALALAREVVVTSPITGRTLTADFNVPAARLTVAEPGTDAASRARGTGRPLQLLAVGSVVPRKAYDVLVHALAPLSDLDWRLHIVGATDRSAEALAALNDVIAQKGLADRITVAGPADTARLDLYYDAADIFVMPSLYEGYGMVLAEAMARGLPIICTTGVAAADTAPDLACIKVPPGDVQAFSRAVGRLMQEPALRRRMADASWAAGQILPRWEETTRRIADVLRKAAA